ncbi:type II toxin-antitoxin system VapC family toxin [Luteolibacter flavescens]|uniref:Type II toxin-antitoxin system VapC family toxin n=1 Tax=Luteolibacter flavescens TaxID=1859460 RepID=A0ABT3FJI2_9BACT|nr:type II toxin-antitoxin system VapC family toxin [Luteolibacter flavescens]MCW1883723.1 type II toxin-antitoxin system VapC family toxin [Luteolibacter flavescens]
MRLLLDTHALLWFCEGNDALGFEARKAMEDPANECYVSHATAWEIAIKLGLGKLRLTGGYESIFPGVLEANGFMLLPPSLSHYQELLSLPRFHGDPFDRLIISQAKVEGLTVVTCDAGFPAYGIPLLW